VELIPISGAELVYFHNSDIIMTGDFYGSNLYPNIDPAHGGSLGAILDGFDAVLGLSDPNTRILTSRGILETREEFRAHKTMILDLHARVTQLFAQGKTQDEVLALHPTSEYDALVPNSKESRDQFVIQLYADAAARNSIW
jgi:cyclase